MIRNVLDNINYGEYRKDGEKAKKLKSKVMRLGLVMFFVTFLQPVVQGAMLVDTSVYEPSLEHFWITDKLYIAWTGKDGYLNLMSSTDGVQFSNKVTLPYTSIAGPSLAVFDRKLYIAWTGKDGYLNLMSSTDGRSFSSSFGNRIAKQNKGIRVRAPPAGGPARSSRAEYVDIPIKEKSFAKPSLATLNGKLYIAWIGEGGRINIMSSTDGLHFGNRATVFKSNDRPSLAVLRGQLWITWTDSNHYIYSAYFTDDTHVSRGSRFELKSDRGPSMANFNNRLYLAWTGRDIGPGHHLYYMSSAKDDFAFGTSKIQTAATNVGYAGPSSLADFKGKLYIAWKDTETHLNVDWIAAIPSSQSNPQPTPKPTPQPTPLPKTIVTGYEKIPWEGNIYYQATIQIPSGILLSVKNPNLGLGKQWIMQIPKPGAGSEDCGKPGKTIDIPPGSSSSALKGTSLNYYPLTFCLGTTDPYTYSQWPSVWQFEITYDQ